MSVELILGPPGTGKTYTLVEKVREYLQNGGHPSKLGMVSFTKKAVEEMLERLCAEFNLEPKDFPYVKTMHALGFAGLGLRTKDIMDKEDYNVIGESLSLNCKGMAATHTEDGLPINSVKGTGAQYLRLIARSRLRKTSLEQEYREAENFDLNFSKLRQLRDTMINYKSTYAKFDYEDMIEVYIETVDPPYLELFIVDEGQDLLPLQWEMQQKISEKSDHTIIAGDDDQAIHRWAGVDVKLFMNSTKNTTVLNQSYRLPHEIWALANRISKRINDRLQKDFEPREPGGEVQTVMHLTDIPLDQGSWTLMARTNSFAQDLAYELEEMGYFYSLKNKPSVPLDQAKAIHVWRELREGKAVDLARVREFYETVPKQGDFAVVKRGSGKLLDAVPPDGLLTYEELLGEFGLVAPKERDEYSIVRVGNDMEQYIRSIERRGQDITKPPRIKVSTFHAMKGGEDDNCVVYTGSTYRCVEENDPDDEHRAFYVAITRARKRLYLLESNKKYRYIV